MQNTQQSSQKKILRVVTFIFCEENYGQILQAYALQRYLRNTYPEQYDVKVIWGMPVGFNKKAYLVHRILGNGIYELLRACKRAIKPSQNENLTILNMRKRRGFNEFKQKYIAVHSDSLQFYLFCTKHHYPELQADVLITGSDQVWNDWGTAPAESALGYEYSWLPYYTLEFAAPQSTKIAYAASMGKREFNSAAHKAYFQKALKDYAVIGVREQSNVDLLASAGVESICVPDPTMLLTKAQWEELVDSSALDLPNNLSQSIFIYTYGDERFGGDELPKILGAHDEVIAVSSACDPDSNDNYNPTLQEWIACIKGCKIMVSGSFHGACFAIMMNTPFFICRISHQASESLNTRFENLVRIFGLEDRIVNSLEELQDKIAQNPPIDWELVNTRLAQWRKVGEEFLQKVL